MDLFFDLEEVQRGVASYDRMILDISQVLEETGMLANGIAQKTWSGEGRRAFGKAFEIWKNRTEFVCADMKKTRESLVEYAANRGIDLREACVRFGDVY